MEKLIQFWQSVRQIGSWIQLRDILDILIVAFLLYQLIRFTRDTRANQVLKGIAIVFVTAQIVSWLGLSALSFLISMIINNMLIVFVILFAPELRQLLERIGRNSIMTDLSSTLSDTQNSDHAWVVDEVVKAVQNMAKTKTGALLILQRKSPLRDILESGTELNAMISQALIENIFVVNTPLHDGATIFRGDRILAAGCFLPLSANPDLPQTVGTRHRAALGISEATDCLAIVVSEETGIISIAENGKLERYIDSAQLRSILMKEYSSSGHSSRLEAIFSRRRHHE